MSMFKHRIMDRKKFLKNSLLIGTGVAGLSKLSASKKDSTYDKLMDNIGSVSYTHLRAPRDRTRSRMPSSA